MKKIKILFIISFFGYISCGGIARAGCKAASKTTAKSGTKAAVKSADDILLQPKVYDDLLKKKPQLGVPKPNVLPGVSGTSSAEITGTATARSVVPNAAIEFKVLNSSGSTVSTLSNANSIHMKAYLQNQYRQEFIRIVDDVFSNISRKQISSSKQLNKEIIAAVKSKIANNKSFIFDASKGNLTYKMDLQEMSGTINIIKSIKDGLVIGASGYYIAKELKQALQIKGKSFFKKMFRGYLFDSQTNQPISQAQVKWLELNKITHSSLDGSFSLYASEEDEENNLTLLIQKNGFEVNKINYEKNGASINIFIDMKEIQ